VSVYFGATAEMYAQKTLQLTWWNVNCR